MDAVYLDHAATTPLDKEILEKMLPYLTEIFGNADSPHALGRKAMNAVDNARDCVAALINAKPNEVYFTAGGTEADNWAVIGGAYAAKEKGRTKLLISAIEHHAVLAAAEKLRADGFEIVQIPVNEGGRCELNALEPLLDDTVGLVAVMAANNETGAVQPIKELADLAHKAGAVFFTDAVQAAPYMPLDVKALGVDMLSLSSHKFYGPKGCGALYIKNGVKIKGHVVGGEQERGLRGGTTNVAAVVGLAEAYKKTVENLPQTTETLTTLRKAFLDGLSVLDGITVNGGNEGDLPSVLNLRIEGVNNADFVYSMDLQGVCVAAGSACASASIKPSHVLTAMGFTEAQAKECVRISFGKYNTEEEVREAAKKAVEIINRLRG
ncbi:MAG: cysteine desulfurase [Clostridia bacterium]|nr:cysteine desulfurase [Clostridia bacterium]